MKKFLYSLSTLLFAARLLAAQAPALPPDDRSLEFIANQGQWPASTRYAAAVPGGHLYLEPTGLRYVLLEPIEHPHAEPAATHPRRLASDSLVRGHQLRVHFVAADADARLQPALATGEQRNYLLGNDPSHWASQVPSYRQVRYQAPWPGVAAKFYENEQHQLEYDFELAAGADPAQVRLRYEGASTLRLDREGRLHVGTTVGELTELHPQAYQTDPTTGQHQPVACRYRLRGEDATVSFELGRYDAQRPLVIDPTVQFSTYTGATTDNWGFTATYDAAGNMYSGGITLSTSTASYPTTMGAFQTVFGGMIDISLIKYNTTVNGPAARVWATYLGGSYQDFPSSLVVNAQNELLVLGTTASGNYPVSATAFQRTFLGGTVATPLFSSGTGSLYSVDRGSDLVISRLSSDGGTLLASTYVGGTGNDGLVPNNTTTTGTRQLPQNYGDPFRSDITLDADGNVYVASVTSSSNFPVTAGSFGPSYRGGTSDAVLLKLPPSLSALTWSGYLGGSAPDAAYSLQLDASRNVYVTGGTMSANFPVTAGALTTTQPGDVDGFVARIAANGSAVQRASYVGTSSFDQSYFVQLGADGSVYLLGQTLGAWPVSAGVYSNSGSHQFIQEMTADLSQRVLSTVFGSGRSTLDISPTAFLVDQCDRVYVCGWGGSVNQNSVNAASNGYTHGLPITANAVRSVPDNASAGSDFYLAQFAPGLKGLLYGTYYGNPDSNSSGDHVDGGTSRFDPRGVVYSAVCSCRNTNSFPVPPGAYTYSSTNNSSNCNNAAFKLNFEPTVATVGSAQAVCANAAPVALTGLPAGGTWSGPGVSGSVSTGFVFTPSVALVGAQTLTYTLTGVVPVCTATGQQVITVQPLPQVSAALRTVCLQAGTTAPTVALQASPAGGTFSGPGVSGSVFSPSVAGPGLHTITYLAGGCSATTTVQVVGATAAALVACATGQPVALSGSPAGGTWSGPGVSGSVSTGFVFTPTTALLGTQTLIYALAAPDNSCSATARVTATVSPVPAVTAPALPTLCQNGAAYALPAGSPTGGTWSGPGVSGSASTGFVFTPSAQLTGTQTLSYQVTNAAGCSGQATTTVQVVPMLLAVAPADTTLCPGSIAAFRLRGSPAGGTWSGPHVSAAGLYTPSGQPGTDVLTYTVLTGLSCQSQAVRRVTLLAQPVLAAAVVPGPCTPAQVAPYTVHFRQDGATLTADAVVRWYFGDDSTAVTGLDVTHTYQRAGTFRPRMVVSYNGSRCANQLALPPVTVQEMLVPNIVLPANPTANNAFRPRVGGCPPRLQIFSRWGRLVYEDAAYQGTWDANGLTAGLYYYLLTPTEGLTPIKGWVEVVK